MVSILIVKHYISIPLSPNLHPKSPRLSPGVHSILPESSTKQLTLKGAQDLVRAVGKIYASLPKDKTSIPEYFLDGELEEFLNEAIAECHARVCSLAEQTKRDLS